MHERGARDLVRRPEVDAVPLAVRRDRRQVDRARAEDERQPGRDERAHDRAHAAEPTWPCRLVVAHQQHQRQLALADLRRRARAAARSRPDRARARTGRAPRARRRAAPGRRRRRRWEAPLEQHLAAVERAQVERDRPGSTPGDARVTTSELLGDVVDAIGVEDQVVALEQPPDAGLVHLHLRAADGQRAEHELAVALGQVVGRLRCPRSRAARRRCSRPAARSSGASPRRLAAAPARPPGRRRGRSGRPPAPPRARRGRPARATSRPSSCATARPRGRRYGRRCRTGRAGVAATDVAALLPQQRRRAQADGAHADDRRRGARRGCAPWRSARSPWPRSCCSRSESSIAETRKGPKNAFCTSSNTSSPAATFEPPTQTAIVLRSSGPRVKNAPCTSARRRLGASRRRSESRTSTSAS